MQVNMHEAKSQLSKLIQYAVDGEDVVIARNNIPVVHLKPVRRNEKGRDDVVENPLLSYLGAGKGLFQSAEEVDNFIREEREQWGI